MGRGGQPKMLEPVTTKAASTDKRLAYQYTDAFSSLPSMISFKREMNRDHLEDLEGEDWWLSG